MDAAKYLAFGNRSNVSRPLFLYPVLDRPFLKRYGQHRAHFNFQSTDPTEQSEFLLDYLQYLQRRTLFNSVKLERVENRSAVLALKNTQGQYFLKFDQDGRVIYSFQGTDGSSAAGSLSLSFELNLD